MTNLSLIGSSNNGNGGYSPGASNLGNVGSLSVVRPDEDVILALGTEALCDDLELKPDDFRILIFAWKCNAEQVKRDLHKYENIIWIFCCLQMVIKATLGLT